MGLVASELAAEDLPVSYAVGIDVGSQSCSFCVLTPDKSIVLKPANFVNAAPGFALLLEQLEQFQVPPGQILVGLEATSRYGENLYQFLAQRGYQLCLLHPGQTHQFAKRRGLRAKTDKLDATTIAHVLLSAEARPGYVPSELIASYRELVRLHTQLSDEVARYKNEIHALLQVLFPEFSQVFADPCRVTALAVLEHYRSRPGYRFGRGRTPCEASPRTGSAQLWVAHRRAVGGSCGTVSKQWTGLGRPHDESENPL
jgi:hypothetical protein